MVIFLGQEVSFTIPAAYGGQGFPLDWAALPVRQREIRREARHDVDVEGDVTPFSACSVSTEENSESLATTPKKVWIVGLRRS